MFGELRSDSGPTDQLGSGTERLACSFMGGSGTGDSAKYVSAFVKIHVREDGVAEDPGELMAPPESLGRRVPVSGVGEKAYAVSAEDDGY
ncbi:hypothetical protein AB0J57_00105 [Streptomyces sp. NPDC049837]|uniref:hypothetical protein n=1 Tax=Streptomyces sp. NPDC049837 TaxID=3155277 RepID=UPI003415D260